MLLEKRPRPPMRRTTSSTEFASSVLFDVEAPQPFDQVAIGVRHLESRWGADWRTTWYTGSMLSPRGGVHRRSSGDFAAPFLRACGLCNRGLGPGRDAYMYRGDIAFCSLECRQQQMNLDEQREKCSVTSTKEMPSAASGSKPSDGGGTVAAA
ncbi:FCS-Like Zinc finger 5 [Musa acuminata AAA Group]|uniref:FCS-Like Zinc finger 5 n=1 Tax=Musa acuminata AAA Group TaxID=214697 RepID=UPI0031D52393